MIISFKTIVPILLFSLLACKKEHTENVTVIKDCTGAYLRLKGKDYKVCNTEMAEPFSNGQAVTATYKEIKECNGTAKDAIVCMMYHESKGWIEIEKIQ